MEAQVENAIQIAWDPRSDDALKSQAFEFLHQLRADPQAWQLTLALATKEPKIPEVVRYVCLDIVNHAIEAGQVDPLSLPVLRNAMMAYLRIQAQLPLAAQTMDSPSIQNKIVQTLTFLFVSLYASQWPSFFGDFLTLAGIMDPSAIEGIYGVKMLLKLLASIHEEVADVLIPRSSERQQRDNDLKDMIRERDIQHISRAWQMILARWATKDAAIVEQCLSIIGKWSGWIDLSLVLNDTLLNLLFDLVNPSYPGEDPNDLRDAALHALIEISSKKMRPNEKIELIRVLKVHEVASVVASTPALKDLRETPNYDTDLAELVAKLINNTVLDIVGVLRNVSSQEVVWSQANAQLLSFLPLVLRFFSDEYDEVCSSVIPCLSELLAFLRSSSVMVAGNHAEMLSPILLGIVAKMRYDETSSWGAEDAQTDEAEFQELRKRLQNLQQAVAAVNEDLYLETIAGIIERAIDDFGRPGQVDWRDVDLALHETYLFGELAIKHGGLYSKTRPTNPAATRLIQVLHKLIASDVASLAHPVIQLQYMEICVRYTTFFEFNAHLIPRVLGNFIRFVHADHAKVQTRSWYLLNRFVKALKHHVGNIAQNAIGAVGDLLRVQAELPSKDQDDENSSEDATQSADGKFDSQLYLYEAVGCLCSNPAVPIETQAMLIESLSTPIFADIEAHLPRARSGDALAILQIHHLVMALGTFGRGYSDWTPAITKPTATPPAEQIGAAFAKIAEAILVALEHLKSSLEIRTAAMFAFSRLCFVLGKRVLPQLPRWIEGFLISGASKEEMAKILRLLDQMVYGFKMDIYDMLNTLLKPFLQRVVAGIAEPISGTDDQIQLSDLKFQYLQFLLVILNNNLAPVFVSQENQETFDTIISTLEHFAKDASDLPIAKMAFSVITSMILTWGGPDHFPPGTHTSTTNVATTSPTPLHPPSSTSPLPGFTNFMLQRFSPLSWAMPADPAFTPNDAQARLVLAEAATMQQAIRRKAGPAYLNWLRDVELQRLGMAPTAIEEYVLALSTYDEKRFRQFFQALVRGISR